MKTDRQTDRAMTTPLHLALADLKDRRAKLDAAIQAIEELLALTPVPAPIPIVTRERRARPTRKDTNGHAPSADDVADKIVAHLKAHGWTKPSELSAAMKVSDYVLRGRLNDLLKAKRVIAVGQTNGRRLALAGTPPPKEAL